MKTVTNVDQFITTLMPLSKLSDNWIIYPEIAGYKARVKILNGSMIVNGKVYDLKRLYTEQGIKLIDGETDILLAPKVDSDWIDTDNVFTIDMQVKTMMDKDLNKVIDDCYLFSTKDNHILPQIPYYNQYNNLYALLNNMNRLDRDLRITDWFNLGVMIKKGNEKILYIKPPLEAITTIKEISYKIGRSGIVIPIAKFEAVSFNGTLTMRATLHNSSVLSVLNGSGLKVNDIVTVKIKRQGHRNSEVLSVLYPFQSDDITPTLTKCPSCNSNLITKKESSYLLCANYMCREKLIKKLLRWCSIDCMNIKGLGIKFIEHLVDLKKVTTIDDLYSLQKEDLLKVPGILDKMADNILKQIEASRKESLIKIFLGLSIDHIGITASKILAWHLMTLNSLRILSRAEIKALFPLITKEQVDGIIDYLKNEYNKEILLNLSYQLNPKLPTIKTEGHKYYQKRFIIKGRSNIFNKSEMINLLKRSGCKYVANDSTEYDYCLYNGDRKVISKIQNKNKAIKMTKLLQDLIY